MAVSLLLAAPQVCEVLVPHMGVPLLQGRGLHSATRSLQRQLRAVPMPHVTPKPCSHSPNVTSPHGRSSSFQRRRWGGFGWAGALPLLIILANLRAVPLRLLSH